MDITTTEQFLISVGILFGSGCIVMLSIMGLVAVIHEYRTDVKWYRSVSVLFFVMALTLFALIKYLKELL